MDGYIRSARIHEYNKPLEMDNISKPVISRDKEVLVKIGDSGLCHSYLHLIGGEWKDITPLNLPKTPGKRQQDGLKKLVNQYLKLL